MVRILATRDRTVHQALGAVVGDQGQGAFDVIWRHPVDVGVEAGESGLVDEVFCAHHAPAAGCPSHAGRGLIAHLSIWRGSLRQRVRPEEEDIRALKKARAAGHSAAELV